MSVFAHWRGHPITTDGSTVDAGDWRYLDGTPVKAEERPCVRCGAMPLSGRDACLGTVPLPGVVAACCGHGCDEPYVLFTDGSGLSGEVALAWQAIMRTRFATWPKGLIPKEER